MSHPIKNKVIKIMSQLLHISQEHNNLWFTVHIAKKHANKMDEFTSIPLDFNSTCLSRTKNNCDKSVICRRCYARIQSAMHPQIYPKMRLNTSTFNDPNYKPSKIKTINNCLRYISFGDVSNLTQCQNILKHANHNPTLSKAIWTKQVKLFTNAIVSTKPIKNLIYIWSSSRIDSTRFIIPKHFTKSFYVYSNIDKLHNAKQIAESKGFKVTECQKSCKSCMVCYKSKSNEIIMELLK